MMEDSDGVVRERVSIETGGGERGPAYRGPNVRKYSGSLLY